MTNFPGGLASYGLPIFPALPGGPVPSGPSSATAFGNGNPAAFFVNSVTGSNGNTGLQINRPLATLVNALTLVKPGDTIYLLPGHVENITGANGVDVTTANVTVVGLGSGNQRAQIVFKTNTTATFRVNATTGDGFYFYNVRVQAQKAGHVLQFTIAAKDVTFDTVDFYEDGTTDTMQFASVTGINFTLKNCYHYANTTAATATQQWILLNAAHSFRCYNNYIIIAGKATSNPANGVIVGVTNASKAVDIRGNFLSVDSAAGNASVTLSLLTASTGLVAYNGLNSTGKSAIAGICALASAMGYQNFVTKTANKSGLLDPVVDA